MGHPDFDCESRWVTRQAQTGMSGPPVLCFARGAMVGGDADPPADFAVHFAPAFRN